jgi:hypothetical protein
MAFGALAGCEARSVFAGECQDASVARTPRASVWTSIIAVQNAGIFTLKVSGVVIISSLLGAAVFLTAERRLVRPFEARA